MPNLVRPGLTVKDTIVKRIPFKRVRIGQIFYSRYHWWCKTTLKTAIPADEPGRKPKFFKYAAVVRILDETMPMLAPCHSGMSLEEFLEEAAKAI